MCTNESYLIKILSRVMIKSIGAYTIIWLLLYSNMLKQYSAACVGITKWNFKYAYVCSGRESYISTIKSKTKLFSNKNRTSHLLSPNRDPCVKILSVTV